MTAPEPLKWRRKPEVVEAIRWDGSNAGGRAISEWTDGAARHWYDSDSPSSYLRIETREGVTTALPGDWIIRGGPGEFFPCKPDTFAATYEPAATPVRDEAADPKPIGWDDVTDEDFITALLDCQEELKQARADAAELRAALAKMSDLVYTIRSAEEELATLRLAGRFALTDDRLDQERIKREAWEQLAELAAEHDDPDALRAALAATEGSES